MNDTVVGRLLHVSRDQRAGKYSGLLDLVEEQKKSAEYRGQTLTIFGLARKS